MRTRAIVFVWGILLLGCLTVSGCSTGVDVTGRVVSLTAGSAVASATVTLGEQSVTTDASGEFALGGVDEGPQVFEVSVEGYPKVSETLTVSGDMGPVELTVADSRLDGAISEVAVEAAVITTAAVTVGGVDVPVSDDGTFSVAGLPPTETTITVESPNRVVKTMAFMLGPGQNSVEVTLSVDVKESYRRYNNAATFERYEVAYEYLHPDVRALTTLEEFMETAAEFTLISLEIGDTREVEGFRSKYTGKTYPLVTQVDRRLVLEYPGYGQETDNTCQHWEHAPDGMWYLVWNFEKE